MAHLTRKRTREEDRNQKGLAAESYPAATWWSRYGGLLAEALHMSSSEIAAVDAADAAAAVTAELEVTVEPRAAVEDAEQPLWLQTVEAATAAGIVWVKTKGSPWWPAQLLSAAGEAAWAPRVPLSRAAGDLKVRYSPLGRSAVRLTAQRSALLPVVHSLACGGNQTLPANTRTSSRGATQPCGV
jgi:hypothetical protein